MKLTIYKKINIFVILLVLGTVVILGSLNYVRTNSILKTIIETEGYKTIKDVDYSVESFIKNTESYLQFISHNKVFSELTAQNEKEMLKIFQDYMNANPSVIDLYIGTTDKRMIDNQASSLEAGYDPTTRDWYKQALAADKLIWSDPYIDVVTNQIVLTAAMPIKINNVVVGVLAVDISLKTISDFVGEIKYGNSGYFIMTDNKGVVLVNPNQDKLGKEIDIINLKDDILKNQQGKLNYSYEGDKKFSVYNSMSSNDWKIIGVIDQSEINKDINQVIKYTVIFGLFIILVAVLISNLVVKPVIKNIKNLEEDVKKIGKGDLTVKSKINADDEIGIFVTVFNGMVENLNTLIKSTKKVCGKMIEVSNLLDTTASETVVSYKEITRTTGEISSVISAQANQASDGASRIEELSKTMETVSNSVSTAVHLCNEVQNINKNGLEVVNDLIVVNDNSNTSSQNVKFAIDKIDESSREINLIVETIKVIAQQTNLLALNASIEAARAGESGRGFAVVAEEIKKLAEQSTDSTKNIQGIIENVKTQINAAVIEINNAKEISDRQTNSVVKTGESFEIIFDSVENLISNINNIYKLNNNMITMKNEIVSVIKNISEDTEETSASTEEISAAINEQLIVIEGIGSVTNELALYVDELDGKIAKFKI